MQRRRTLSRSPSSYLSKLPPEILEMALLRLPYPEILGHCDLFCDDNDFWLKKAALETGQPITEDFEDRFNKGGPTPVDRYLQILPPFPIFIKAGRNSIKEVARAHETIFQVLHRFYESEISLPGISELSVSFHGETVSVYTSAALFKGKTTRADPLIVTYPRPYVPNRNRNGVPAYVKRGNESSCAIC